MSRFPWARIITCCCILQLLPVGAGAGNTISLELNVHVSGDVQAALVDHKGRRTGWYGGWIEDIPNCRLEAIRDEVAEPQDYTFHLGSAGKQSYRLLLMPRTEGEVSIVVEGLIRGARACIAHVDTELVAGESEWLLSWSSRGDKCKPSITPRAAK